MSDDVSDAPGVERPAYGPYAIVAFVALFGAATLANILFARLVADHPERLISLSSRNRYLIGAIGSGISAPVYALIATTRLAAAAIVCHLLGRAYGDRALHWLVRFLGVTNQQLAQFEEGYLTAEWVLLPIFVGSNLVYVLSGAVATPLKRLVPLLLVGIAGRLALLWWLTQQFESQVKSVINVITRYQLPVLAVSFAIVVLVNIRNIRRGRA